MIMTYNRGTIEEFNLWHQMAMAAENIPTEGRIGFVNGVPAPQNQRTIAYSSAIPHPTGGDDYIWFYGKYPDTNKPELSTEDARNAGWFQM
jgi:hypothetical protein